MVTRKKHSYMKKLYTSILLLLFIFMAVINMMSTTPALNTLLTPYILRFSNGLGIFTVFYTFSLLGKFSEEVCREEIKSIARKKKANKEKIEKSTRRALRGSQAIRYVCLLLGIICSAVSIYRSTSLDTLTAAKANVLVSFVIVIQFCLEKLVKIYNSK